MIIKHLKTEDYSFTWEKMKEFTANREKNTQDELWVVQHYPVYTQGQAGKAEHIIRPTNIPIIQSDRGGQITYHGPGQLVAYVLMDIVRRNMGIRTLVCDLEAIIVKTLEKHGINATTRCGAPGVYVTTKKIASIGLRVKHGRTYHGIALNVRMDLTPFNNINPCGYAQMEMTQISDFAPQASFSQVAQTFVESFISHFESTDHARIR